MSTTLRANGAVSAKILVLAGVIGAACITGCEQSTTPPPATPPPAGNAGNSGPLSGLSETPTSLPGRSAAAGRNAARMLNQEQSRTAGLAQEISGEAVPVEVSGVVFSVPAGWEKANAAAPRVAEFKVGETGEGSVVFFYFGASGGTVAMNIDRWKAMVTDATGGPAEAEVVRRTVQGMPVSLVSIEGTYQDGMPGQPKTPRPEYAFRGAILEAPQGNVFIRFTGPKGVVEGAEGEWSSMIEGARKK